MKRNNPPSRRVSQLDTLGIASNEDVNNSLPSPPYRAFPSSSNLVEALHGRDTPAYCSRVDLMVDYRKAERDEKITDVGIECPGDDDDNLIDAQPKPSVHYPAHVNETSAPGYFQHTPPKLESRASSILGTDDEHEDGEGDDYNWSAEEDLADQQAEYEKHLGVIPKPQGWGIKRIATLLFSSLIGSTFLAAVLLAPAILINFFWYKKNPTDHRRFVTHNVEAWLFWAAANLMISWYLAMIVDIIPVIIWYLISFSWGHVSEHVKNRIELYDSVKDTIKPLLYAGSAWISWIIIFQNIFKLYNSGDATSPAAYTDRVHEVVVFLFFLALVLCVQRMLSQAIAFAFHRVAYAERMESVRETLSVIETLRNYKPKQHHGTKSTGSHTPVFSALGFGGISGGGDGRGRTPLNEKEHYHFLSSALRRASNTHEDSAGEEGDVEDGVHGVARKNKGKQKRRSFRPAEREDSSNTLRVRTATASQLPSRPATPSEPNPNTHADSDSPHRYPPSTGTGPARKRPWDEGDTTLVTAAKVIKTAMLHDARNIKGNGAGSKAMAWNVNSEYEARRLAKSIYYCFKDRKRTWLVPSDFYPAFPTPSEAEAAFHVFDKDDNGDISRSEIKSTLVKVYKERRFLSRSMRDVGVALKTLNHILLFFAFVILFFISLSVFGVQVGDSLTSVYTIGIAASFVFKNAASSAFDAVMFLFVTHPFDTGDRCFIDDENFVVKKMGLFATVFTRADGTETYYFNSLLFTKFITNVRRSGKMFENLTMQVAWRTPLEKLDALEKCVNEWIQTEENRWFEPSTSLTFQTIDYQRHLVITMAFGHNGTWQDWGLRNARKTAFHAAVQYYCRELGIEAYEAPMPVEYADYDSQKYIPSSPMREGSNEPLSPGAGSTQEQDTPPAQEEYLTRKECPRNVLGFKPPQERKPSELTRTRKSKSRKTALRSMGAGGG